MSVTFEHSANPQRLVFLRCEDPAHGDPALQLDCPDCRYVEAGGPSLNLANANAAALAAWLQLPDPYYGELPVSDFRALLRRALWARDPEAFERASEHSLTRRVVRDQDGLPHVSAIRLHSFGLSADRLREYAVRLLAVCDLGGDTGSIRWG